MTTDEKSVFLFSKVVRKSTDKNAEADFLLRYDIDSQAFFKKTALKIPPNSYLMPYDSHLSGFTMVSFDRHTPCGSGRGVGLAVRLAGVKAAKTILPKGTYFMGYRNDLPMVSDQLKGKILDVDIQTFQKRIALDVGNGFYPLYWDASQHSVVALKKNGKSGYDLLRYKPSTKETLEGFTLKDSLKLIQQRQSFIVASIGALGQTLSIREVKGFSGAKNAKYQVNLPKPFAIEEGFYTFDLKAKLLLVYKKDPLRTRRWDRAFVIDYAKDQILGEIPVPKGTYVAAALIVKEPYRAIFMLKAFKNGNLVNVREFRVSTGKWKPVRIRLQ